VMFSSLLPHPLRDPAPPPAGSIDTIAGNGNNTFGGDGGPAASASLRQPFAVALDTTGNVYLADVDSGNVRIRIVYTNGTIDTIVGTGIFIFGEDGGPATSASIYTPRGVAVDTDWERLHCPHESPSNSNDL
jgi:hypothetical protein